MCEIEAFHGLRYDLGHVGSLSDVIAPPYDVIDDNLQETLYKKHPCNVIRLILNRKEPSDDEANNRYTRAARFLKNWKDEGVLFRESNAALYVYHQEYTVGGQSYLRKGFMARLRLSRFGEGQVFPHEETMAGPKVDRLMLTTVCRTNLSQIFGLYPDPNNEAQNLLEAAAADITPIVATDHLGIVHRLFPVTSQEVIASAAGAMGPKPIFVADGHHRYETACNYRDHIRDTGSLTVDHPANFVLMHCVAMEDPGLLVLPTHRLFRGIDAIGTTELRGKLGECFTCTDIGQRPEQATHVWEEIETRDDQGTLALFSKQDNRWTLASITDQGRARMTAIAQDHNEEWQSLGVSLLHRLIIRDLLGIKELPKPSYVHAVEEVIAGLSTDEFPLAALVMPATVDHIRAISLQGERMPAKSTYFFPKLLSGLVFNPLE